MEISNYDDEISSLDINKRYEQLGVVPGGDISVEEYDEFIALQKLVKDGRDANSDWDFGVYIIRDSYFQEYAIQYAEDIGAIRSAAAADDWPMTCIDWDRAAKDLQADYTAIDFDGRTYWIAGRTYWIAP